MLLIWLKNWGLFTSTQTLSQGTQVFYLDWLVPLVTRSNLKVSEYNVDRNNAYDSLVTLSSIFMYMAFVETSQWSTLMQWPT